MPTVLIAGGSGLVGTRLSRLLSEQNYEVTHLSRSKRPDTAYSTFQWDLKEEFIEEEAILQADYIVNLAGAGIADKRWTPSRKKMIIDSRVDSARLILSYLQRLNKRPAAYLSSSAIGFYGDRGDEWMKETARPGQGFLPESCILWEEAIAEVAAAGIRTVAVRTGIVLSTQGGALPKMILPARFFLGAYFGSGQQWFSWVHIEDLCRIFIQAIEDEKIEGTFNGVAPNPVTNKELTARLVGEVNPSALLIPAPEFALRIALGEMADAVLDSTRVSSEKIESTGFEFKFPEVSEALQDVLERKL